MNQYVIIEKTTKYSNDISESERNICINSQTSERRNILVLVSSLLTINIYKRIEWIFRQYQFVALVECITKETFQEIIENLNLN